jgi:hypothetical protein
MSCTAFRHTSLTTLGLLALSACTACSGGGETLAPEPPRFAKAAAFEVADVVAGDFAPGAADAPALATTCPGATSPANPAVVFGKTRCLLVSLSHDGVDYEMTDDMVLAVQLEKGKNGRITHIRLNGQDVDGEAGLWHNTDLIAVEQPAAPDRAGFTLHVHAANVPVYRWDSHLPRSGQRVGVVGYISIGDIIYRIREDAP